MHSLFEQPSTSAIPFAGATYQPAADQDRLHTQVECIRLVVADEHWRTIQKLAAECRRRYPQTGFPENSVQAQLRNLKKIGFHLEKRHVARGLFEYRMLPPANPGVGAAMRKGAGIV